MDDTAPQESARSGRSRPRRGIALCLSGGGFRAALFHLGALRRLNELGVLAQVDTISAVSGGSIIAAHLAHSVRDWPAPGQSIPDWDTVVAEPFHRFVGRNLRTGPLLARAIPANWSRPETAVEALADRLRQRLTDLALTALPARPHYIFSATDMTFGVNWTFERDSVGDYQAGYLKPGAEWSVARAVAASSCFPPVFDPMHLRLDPGTLRRAAYRKANRDELVRGLLLTDGGVYDNMGLEPVWKDHQTVLVSDGGGVFDYTSSSNALKRLLRYPTLIGNQASSIRKRWLIAGLAEGALVGGYWGISTTVDAKNAFSYSKQLVEDVISAIRTDLDAFSAAEIAVLENHGYAVADHVLIKRAKHLISESVPFQPPFPEWISGEERIQEALGESDRRTFLGRR